MTIEKDAYEAIQAEVDALQQAAEKRPNSRRLQEKIERMQIKAGQAMRAWELAESAIEEAPLLRDLGAIGVDVPTVWDLYLYPDAYPDVIPVLLKHLAMDYPPGTLEGIGGALGHKSARPWWGDLKQMYLADKRGVVRDRLAAVLSQIAVREHYEDLLSLFENSELGKSRIFLVRTINRIGNRKSPGSGSAAIEPFANDRDVGIEVTRALKGIGLDK